MGSVRSSDEYAGRLHHIKQLFFFFYQRVNAVKVCTACSRTSNKIVTLNNVNKCLYRKEKREKDLNTTFKFYKSVHHRTIQITNQMQQFSSLLSCRLFTAQHVSGVLPPIIRSSMTAVAASGFTFVSW